MRPLSHDTVLGKLRTATALLALFVATPTAVLAASDTRAVTSTSWSPVVAPLPFNTSEQFGAITAMACPTAGWCVAVGEYNDTSGTQGFIDTLSGGVWQAEQAPLLADAVGGTLNSVSCAAEGACVAGGSEDHSAMLETLSDGVWTPALAPLPSDPPSGDIGAWFPSIACPTAGNCVALGEIFQYDNNAATTLFTDTEEDGTWTLANAPVSAAVGTTPQDRWEGLSCPDAGDCDAAAVLDGLPAPCDTAAGCGNPVAIVDTLADGVWSSADTPMPSTASTATPFAEFSSISCASSTSCTAVGWFVDTANVVEPFAETLAAGSWSGSELPLPEGGTNAGMDSVSCPDTSTCVAVGEYTDDHMDLPDVETLSDGVWTQATPPDPVDAVEQVGLNSIDCTSDVECVAVGSYEVSGGSLPMIDELSSGSWTSVAGPLPPDAAGPQSSPTSPTSSNLATVSCPTISTCVSVGTFSATPVSLPDQYPQLGLIETMFPSSAAVEATTTTVGSSTPTSAYGQSVTFTATVDPADGGGTVAFSADGASIAACDAQPLALVGGSYGATCTTSTLAIGNHMIGATYSGDAVAAGSTGSTNELVAAAAQAITFTSSAPSPAAVGGTYAVTATGGGSGNPVTFSTSSAACTVTGAAVHFLHVGTCSVEADEGGDTDFAAAPQVTQDVVVARAGTHLAGAAATARLTARGWTLVLRATLTSVVTGHGLPGAEVRFALDGVRGLGCVAASSAGGAATCTVAGSGRFPRERVSVYTARFAPTAGYLASTFTAPVHP